MRRNEKLSEWVWGKSVRQMCQIKSGECLTVLLMMLVAVRGTCNWRQVSGQWCNFLCGRSIFNFRAFASFRSLLRFSLGTNAAGVRLPVYRGTCTCIVTHVYVCTDVCMCGMHAWLPCVCIHVCNVCVVIQYRNTHENVTFNSFTSTFSVSIKNFVVSVFSNNKKKIQIRDTFKCTKIASRNI